MFTTAPVAQKIKFKWIGKYLKTFVFFSVFLFNVTFATPDDSLEGFPYLHLRISDSNLFLEHYQQGSGGDLLERFVRFLFPITGREKRTLFMPLPYWGEKKPQFEQFDWFRHESDHFVFYTYDKGRDVIPKVISFIEDDYERNNRLFGVHHDFTKKIPIIFYKTRRDFEQTHIISGTVPEGLGGVTELFAWKRATFPFEGEMQKLEHVAKHEGTHIYQIAKGAKRFPLWFIEGTAETNSIYWDADAEMVIRDAYLNGFFFKIQNLWQIQGTWLMYKIGNFVCNLIYERFGEEGLRKIYDNGVELGFEENIKKSLGVSVEELGQMVEAKLSQKYAQLLNTKDLQDHAKLIQSKAILMHAHQQFFITGEPHGPRNALFINHLSQNGKVTKKMIIADRKLKSESLNFFAKGAWLNEQSLIYSVKNRASDELRIVNFSFDEQKKKFKLKETIKRSWKHIEVIESPVIINPQTIAFIGVQNGFSNIYFYHLGSSHPEALTDSDSHVSGLDYSPSQKKLVFSKETFREEKRLKYNRDLYTYDLETQLFDQITFTPESQETHPRFSSQGRDVLYLSDAYETFNAFIINVENKVSKRITKMKVGLNRPQWGPKRGVEESIWFNASEKMIPNVYLAPMPNVKDQLELLTPQLGGVTAYVKENQLVIPTTSENNVDLIQLNHLKSPFVTQNMKLGILYDRSVYQPLTFAYVDGHLFFEAKKGFVDQKISEEKKPKKHFFELKENHVHALNSNTVAVEDLLPQEVKRIEEKFEGRPIVKSWKSVDSDSVLLIINNRLAKRADRFKKLKNESAYIYNLKTDHFTQIHESIFTEQFQKIQWVSFFDNQKIFLVISDQWKGPFEMYTYDPHQKKLLFLNSSSEKFDVDPKNNSVAWLKDHRVMLHDAHGFTHVYDRGKKVKGFRFTQKGLKIVDEHKDHWRVHLYSSQTKQFLQVFQKEMKNETLMEALVGPVHGEVMFHSRVKKDPNEKEKLYALLPEEEFYDISARGQGVKFSDLFFIQDVFVFSEQSDVFVPSKTWAWKNKTRDAFERIEKWKGLEQDQISLVLQSKNKLFVYDLDEKLGATLANETAGFDVKGEKLLFSTPVEDHFGVYEYDLLQKKSTLISDPTMQAVGPVFGVEDQVFYSNLKDDQWVLEQVNLKTKKNQTTSFPGFDLLLPKETKEGLSLKAYRKSTGLFKGPQILEPVQWIQDVDRKKSDNPFKLQSLTAAAAFDGKNFRFFLSGFLDNLFSDQGMFVDGMFLGSQRFATASFVDLKKSQSYSAFFNDRSEIQNYGFGIAKGFILDRYREITVNGIFEVQDYGMLTPDSADFITPNEENETFYLLKSGVNFAYDVTVWDRHGPTSGARLFVGTEFGTDLGNARFANADGNLDFRLYHRILPRFGFAHRIIAGTSQGNLPNFFLSGGDLSFRGVGFDSLKGQNYWIFSEDLRLPVFDFIGAQWFDPVDQFLGIFTRYFDIRAGLYFDVGGAWKNNQNYETLYSLGWFVSVPTMLGINLRFHQGFMGEERFGFWIGANW